MKKILIIFLTFMLLLVTAAGCVDRDPGDDDGPPVDPPQPPTPPEINYTQLYSENRDRALAYADIIKEKYWVSSSQTSFLIPGAGAPYLWPYTEQVAMANSVIALLDKEKEAEKYAAMKTYLEELLEGLRYYRVQQTEGYTNVAYGQTNADCTSYAIYNSGRSSVKDNAGTGKGGIFFDDNIWVVKEFYNAYKNLGDEKYLNEAVNVANWIIGEGLETEKCAKTGKNMYGVYWNWGAKFLFPGVTNDSENASLNTCSSAPTAMMLVKLYNEMKTAKFDAIKNNYLITAKRVFNFVYSTLRDEASDTFKDKIFIFKDADGNKYLATVDEQILPYNTGCMMTAAAELYKDAAAKKETANADSYLKRAKEIAAGADVKFAGTVAVEGQYTYNKNSWFTSFLAEGFADIAPFDDKCEIYLDHMRSSLDYGWKNNRASDGLVCPAWTQGWGEFTNSGVSEENPRQILLQSANAHSYSMLAHYYRTLAEK